MSLRCVTKSPKTCSVEALRRRGGARQRQSAQNKFTVLQLFDLQFYQFTVPLADYSISAESKKSF
jgi:hypothetical protein